MQFSRFATPFSHSQSFRKLCYCEMNFSFSITKEESGALLPRPRFSRNSLKTRLSPVPISLLRAFVLLCNACLWFFIINLSMKLMAIFPGNVCTSITAESVWVESGKVGGKMGRTVSVCVSEWVTFQWNLTIFWVAFCVIVCQVFAYYQQQQQQPKCVHKIM